MKQIWIFGDSYGENCKLKFPQSPTYQWPVEISKVTNVKNFAFAGCGPETQLDYLLDKIIQNNTTNIDVIFFISHPMRKPYNFYEDPSHQTYIKSFFNEVTNLNQYAKYDDYIKKDVLYNDINCETQVYKYLCTLKELSKYVNKMLVYTNFILLPDNLVKDVNTDSFHFMNMPLAFIDYEADPQTPNHLREVNHKTMYKQIFSYFTKGTSIDIFKFKNLSPDVWKKEKIRKEVL